jgi:putative endonuclease
MFTENRKNDFYVYIVECIDKTFYTGYSNDVGSRVSKHNSGKGAKYTKTRLPVKLIYFELCGSKSDALKREYQIKQLTRKQKEQLINRET